MADEAVAPELLNYIDDYIAETDFNEVVRSPELDSDSNLIVFYRELFAQLFSNVLGERLLGINTSSGLQASRLYQRNRKNWSPGLRKLVKDFQRLCKIYPDMLGQSYGGGNDSVSDLHFTLLPDLLTHLEAWADETGAAELSQRAAEARREYSEFIDTFEPA